MMDGFDLESPLVCEGIIGDGCGGGRIFFIDEESLKVYDPITKDNFSILENIETPNSIDKTGCIIFIRYKNKTIEFNLSELK